MRLAIIADQHYDEGSRFEECIRIHNWIADDVAARGVDLVLLAGDLYERKSTPNERLAASAWIRRLAETAPVVIVRGNHDALDDLPLLVRLDTNHPVTVEEGAGVVIAGGAAVGCLAWPRKGRLLSRLAADVSGEEAGQVAATALQNVIRGLGVGMAKHDGPRILLAHAMVRGSVTSHGQPLVGCDMEIGLEDLALAGAGLYALGHIHMPQDWEFDGAPIVYPGSPRRTSFGEVEEKGYVIAEFDGQKFKGWERIPTPATPMVLVEDEWGFDAESGEFGWLAGLHGAPEDFTGAEVRFRYHVDADHRDAAKAAAEKLSAWMTAERGAVMVKVDDVVRPTTRARVPEIIEAKGLDEKIRLLWEARDDVPDSPRADRLLSLIQTIEEEAASETR